MGEIYKNGKMEHYHKSKYFSGSDTLACTRQGIENGFWKLLKLVTTTVAKFISS